MYSLVDINKDFLVVNKYPQVNVHREGGRKGLVQKLGEDFQDSKIYLVHRLDKVCSGLLLLARNRLAARNLSKLFEVNELEKYYLALSDRRPKKKKGLVVGDMEKSRRGQRKLIRTKFNPAITLFLSRSVRGKLRLFILKPLTGKTHQLRVALKSLGSPVLGDPVYYRKKSLDQEWDRCYLHAYALRFYYLGRLVTYTAWPDQGILFNQEDFGKALADFKRPWEVDWPVKSNRHEKYW